MKNIVIKNLSKNFGALEAVKNLNLEIDEGEMFAFLGPNGAGKTTTVKLLCGVLKPASGSVHICGIDASENPVEAKMQIGVVPDHPFIYPKLTGEEFLHLVGGLYGVGNGTRGKKISDMLEMFDLKHAADDLIETYSLGMRQKIIIASMLIHDPKVVILDEPLVGLDPKSARLVKDIFIELCRRGSTIFMCTHILEIAEKLADRIGIIDKGTLIAAGTKEHLRSHVQTGETLEEIYLQLTGGFEYAELLKYL
jgi:ABC-2 type transport system ATP-binding protein